MKHLLIILLSISVFQVSAQYSSYSRNQQSNKAFLGIQDADMNRQKADLLGLPNAYGSYIKYVYLGTAAEAAGVQPFDYIIGIDNKMMAFHTDLTDLLSQHKPGDRVSLQIVRQGKTMNLNATLGRSSDSSGEHHGGSAFLGIQIHELNKDYETGVKIETVRNSSAIDLGLDDGDVIMAINGYPMIDWSDITTVLNNMDEGDPIKIDYTRNNQPNRASGSVGGEHTHDNHSTTHHNHSKGRGFLGIYSGDMNKTKADLLDFDHHYGSYIKKVIPNSAADRSGLEPLDYIIAINDYQMGKDRSLTGALSKFSSGDEVTVHYIRNGQPQRAQAILGDPSDDQNCSPCSDLPFFGVSANYDNNRGQTDRGVKVNIVKKSAAAASGLESGDIIIELDGKSLIDWSDLSAVINGTEPGERIEVTYNRGSGNRSLEAVMGSECDQNGNHSNENYSFDYNFDTTFGNNDQNEDEPAVDMNRIKVDIQDMDDNDAGDLRNNGVTMPTVNNLSVENISLFPNPNRGMFRLEFELPNSAETSIKVFNSNGRLIYSFDLGEYQGLFSDEVDISQNGPGAYYLQVQQGANSLTKKIMLQY